MFDYHVHSSLSFDCSKNNIDDYCALAQARGLKGITFTEHIEFSNTYGGDFEIDYPLYFQQLELARKKYPDLIIGQGMEMGLQPHLLQRDRAISQKYAWDFILGSVHIIDGLELFAGDYCMGKTQVQAYTHYLESLYQLVKDFYPYFDVLGHLDLVRRDASYGNQNLKWQDYADYVDPILQELIVHQKGLEVNTSGWRYGLEAPHPDFSILKRYKQLGGEIITCGSDSHTANYLGYRFKEAYEIIQAAGFDYVSVFQQRQATQYKIKTGR